MVNHICYKCQKIFNSPSKLERHKNNKKPCNETKQEYKCETCNLVFTRPSHKIIHEKTKKHKNKIELINNTNEEQTSTNINENILEENVQLKKKLII
jgi:transposase-like protein